MMRTSTAPAFLLLSACSPADWIKDQGSPETGALASDDRPTGLFAEPTGPGRPPGGDQGGDTAADSVGDTGESRETAETADTGGRAPSTMWVQVSLENTVAAAITDNGSLACWGPDGSMEFNCPAGYFTEIAQGDVHGCGLDEAGVVACWGGGVDDFAIYNVGQLKPPPGRFVRMDSGRLQSCALDSAGVLTCWGCNDCGYTLPSDGPYDEVSVNFGWGCVLSEAGGIECWGYDKWGVQDPPDGSGWHGLAVGSAHGCVLDGGGFPTCWGGEDVGVVEGALTDVAFKSISSGAESVCGITLDDEIRCWESTDEEGGSYGDLDREAPAGTYLSVATGSEVACALSTAGEIDCFGDHITRTLNTIPDLPE